jgi:hypothetical protein
MDRGGWAGEIINPVDFDIERKCHVVPEQLEPRLHEQMSDVLFIAGEEIIHTKNVMPLGEQSFGQM